MEQYEGDFHQKTYTDYIKDGIDSWIKYENHRYDLHKKETEKICFFCGLSNPIKTFLKKYFY